jgi:predicted lipid-binding transport protein (Tim44 family)
MRPNVAQSGKTLIEALPCSKVAGDLGVAAPQAQQGRPARPSGIRAQGQKPATATPVAPATRAETSISAMVAIHEARRAA